MPKHQTARSKGVDPHTEGELNAWGGIVSGRLTTWAGELDTDPEAVLEALETAGIEPLVDTARDKGGGYERAEDPSLRCLALTREDAERLRRTCDKTDPGHSESGSTECTLALTTDDATMSEAKTKDLRVRVCPRTYNRVEAVAERSGQTMSDVVRNAVRDRVDQNGKSGLSDRAD